MRNWLVEPDYAAAQRKLLSWMLRKRGYVTSRTQSGYRRIKGPAGSGKSLILAARAAQLLGEGKGNTVHNLQHSLCFYYLMDVAVRWPSARGRTRQGITWLNFHAWCKRVCEESDREDEYRDLWKGSEGQQDEVLSTRLPALVASCIDSDVEEVIQRYDAVLMDEGAGFSSHLVECIKKSVSRRRKMLLVADATQDIYGTARSWTDRNDWCGVSWW